MGQGNCFFPVNEEEEKEEENKQQEEEEYEIKTTLKSSIAM